MSSPPRRKTCSSYTERFLWDAAHRANDPEVFQHARRLQEQNRGLARRAERPRRYDPTLITLAHAALARKDPNTKLYDALAKALKVDERTIRRLVAKGRPIALPPKKSRGKQ
jgi:hypothetical protein